MSKFVELSEKYVGQAAALLNGIIGDDPETISKLIEIIQNGIDEGMTAGEKAGKGVFPYQIGQQRAKVTIEGDNPPDGINTHYYWAMRAGFAEQAEAEAYITALREQEPGTQYGLFVDGIPVDYE